MKKSPIKNSKPSLSNRKTSSPLKTSSSSKKLKATSIPKMITADQSLNSKHSKSRQILTQTLDTYTLLIRSKNPIRCLQHNSDISIYCQTQQKLLCANCIFGRSQHKFHRVTPMDKSYDKIQKDIDTMNRLIDREIDHMKNTGDMLMEGLVMEENDAHDCLTNLVQQYEECHKRLEECFLISKGKIIEKLEKVRKNYQTLILQLKLHMQNYGISNLMKPINRQYFKKQQFLLFEHVVCNAIASQKKFDANNWLTKKREVYGVGTQQRKKIMTIIQMISRMNIKEH